MVRKVLISLMSVTAQTRTGNLSVMADATAALSKMDVVYVVRQGDQNINLKYSLRTLVNLPHRRVYIAGYMPEWVEGCISVPRDQDNQPDQQNSNLNLLEASRVPELSEDFIFMNDDFMVMEPVTRLPHMHQGSLNARIAAYKSDNRMHQAFSLIATRTELQRIMPGKELLSYELHMPMIFNKQKLQAMFAYWSKLNRPSFSLRPRTFYGNVYQIEGVETKDAKTTSRQEGQFISTVSNAYDSELWQHLRARFQTAGKYESSAEL